MSRRHRVEKSVYARCDAREAGRDHHLACCIDALAQKTQEIIGQWLYVLLDVRRDPLPWGKPVSRTRTGFKCAAWSTCHFARTLVFACVAATTVGRF